MHVSPKSKEVTISEALLFEALTGTHDCKQIYCTSNIAMIQRLKMKVDNQKIVFRATTNVDGSFYRAVLLCFQHGLDQAHNNLQDKLLRIEALRENQYILCIYQEQ